MLEWDFLHSTFWKPGVKLQKETAAIFHLKKAPGTSEGLGAKWVVGTDSAGYSDFNSELGDNKIY